MTSFTFATAGSIAFGVGVSADLSAHVSALGEAPFVLTGSTPARYADLLVPLAAPSASIGREPTLADVRAATERAREARADVIVAVGGGSVIDAAKIIAMLLSNGGDPLDYAEVIGAGHPITQPSVPLIAIPTTAGTGAEVTANGVVASPDHGVKVSLRSPSMLPHLALIDPALTLSCPPAVTAASGLDALTQCLEPFVSPFATALTDGFSRTGLAAAQQGLRAAFADGADIDARTQMSLCALMGGLALANAKLGAVHGFAGVIGGMVDAAHGAICAALLPAVCRANLDAMKSRDRENPAIARYDEVASLLTGSANTDVGLRWIEETVRLLQVPGLGALGLAPEAIDEVAQKAARASSMKGNPIELTHDELVECLLAAL